MPIRAFRPADAPLLPALFHAAVHGPATHAYDADQRAAWSPAPPDPARFLARASDGRLTLVAIDDGDRLVGYGDLERDGHLDHFYCHPDASGSGVMAALYAELEAAARDWGLRRIFVEASEPARSFFLKQGFTLDHRRDFTIGGVAIHNYAMSKIL